MSTGGAKYCNLILRLALTLPQCAERERERGLVSVHEAINAANEPSCWAAVDTHQPSRKGVRIHDLLQDQESLRTILKT